MLALVVPLGGGLLGFFASVFAILGVFILAIYISLIVIGWLIVGFVKIVHLISKWQSQKSERENQKQAEKVNAEIESIRKIAKKRDPNVEAILEVHRIKYGAYEKMRNSD